MKRAIVCAALSVTAFLAPSRAQEVELQWGISVAFPGKSWAVATDSPGFVIETRERKPDGREFLFTTNSQTGVGLSVMLEQSKGGADSKTCPAYLTKRVESISQFEVTDVKTSEIDSMSVIEHLIPKANGLPVQQKNLVACAAKDDIYVDIHRSNARFQPADESLLTDVLGKIHFVDQSATASVPSNERAPSPSGASSLDYFRQGSRYYLAHDYGNAIPLSEGCRSGETAADANPELLACAR